MNCIHYNNITYDKCRDCDRFKCEHCENYVSYSRQTKPLGTSVTAKIVGKLDKTADNYIPLMVRMARKTKILPKNYQDWIRRWNDEGVI